AHVNTSTPGSSGAPRPQPISGDAQAGLAVDRRTRSGCALIRTRAETGRGLIVSALGRGPARMPRMSACAADQRIRLIHLAFGMRLRITGTVGRRPPPAAHGAPRR